MEISDKTSNAIWQMKGFAIFTVFFAHMPGHSFHGSSIVWKEVFDIIGTFGVPIFLMISGYFDKISHTPLLIRLKKLLIPLIIWGSFTYTLHIIKRPSDNILLDYIYWLYGCNNYLYFVPVLIWCILLSRICNEWLLIILGIISQILSSNQIIPYNHLLTTYINPFNFIVYFAFGRLIRQFLDLEKIGRWTFSICAIVLVVFLLILHIIPVYDCPYTIIVTICSFLISYYVFYNLNCTSLVRVGKYSYVLYLSHIQIAGFIQIVMQKTWGTFYEPIKVFIAFLVSFSMCYVLQWMISSFHYDRLLGYLGYKR